MATTKTATRKAGTRVPEPARPTRASSQAWLHQSGIEIQEFGKVRQVAIGLSADTRRSSCQLINHVLADTLMLHALYKKHHWSMRGATFYQLHLLLDKHAGEQEDIIDEMAERIAGLGGVAVADPRHAAELTTIARPPDGVEEVPAMISRLLEAHETILIKAHEAAGKAAGLRDDATSDMLIADVIRTGEKQAWMLSEHLVNTPLVRV